MHGGHIVEVSIQYPMFNVQHFDTSPRYHVRFLNGFSSLQNRTHPQLRSISLRRRYKLRVFGVIIDVEDVAPSRVAFEDSSGQTLETSERPFVWPFRLRMSSPENDILATLSACEGSYAYLGEEPQRTARC